MPDVDAPLAPSPAPAKQRDPWFDNAKMALVTLVVLGHSWTLLPLNLTDGGSSTATQVDTWLYNFLYAWHIPAFVIVTGYLSRSFEYTRVRMWNLVTTVAVPYVIFEGVYALYRHVIGGVDFERLWANPHWPMWYLSAMFFWRLMTPIFKRMPGKVVVAVAISLLAGPLRERHLRQRPHLRAAAVLRAGAEDARGPLEPAAHPAGALVRHRRAAHPVRARPLLRGLDRDRVALLPLPLRLARPGQPARHRDPDVAAARRAWSAPSPSSPSCRGRKTWFSALGGATLVVYLFHGFFVLGAEFAGFKGWAADHWPLSLILVTMLAPALAIFLAWKPVSSRLNDVRRPDRDVQPTSGTPGAQTRARSGPQLGVTALNGTTSSSRAR